MKLIANQAEIDRKAVLHFGIPPETLMHAAGSRVADLVSARCASSGQGVIVCGPGNNGGDGFVCARALCGTGFHRLSVIYSGADYRGETLHYLEQLLTDAPVPVIDARQQLETALSRIAQADFIVDALFGSGLNRPVSGAEARLIAAINQRRAEVENVRVISVDLPSGIDAISGQILGTAVRADETMTFSVGKPGLYLFPGKALAGRVSIADIGMPAALIEEDESPFRLITTAQARDWLPTLRPDAHKYDCGNILVLAGSRKMPGAAALCAEAAMSAGAGLVTLASPASVFSQLTLMPEIMHLPLADEERLTAASLPCLESACASGRFNAIVLGPGLGREPETVQAVLAFLKKLVELPGKAGPAVILDADALNALSTEPMTLNERFILTPHVGECARLLGISPEEIRNDLPTAASRLRTARIAHTVLKSATTVIAPLSQVASGSPPLLWISSAGNPGMATAGSGDVLSGIIGALASRTHAAGLSLSQAALLGVHLHGLAGDIAAKRLTPYAMRASDITRHLSQAFALLLE